MMKALYSLAIGGLAFLHFVAGIAFALDGDQFAAAAQMFGSVFFTGYYMLSEDTL